LEGPLISRVRVINIDVKCGRSYALGRRCGSQHNNRISDLDFCVVDLAVWFSDDLAFPGIEDLNHEIDQALGIRNGQIRGNRVVTGGEG
jgi:hypothetical protein